MGLKMENNEDALKDRIERSSSQYEPLNFLTHFDFKIILKRILPTDRGAFWDLLRVGSCMESI